MGLEPANTIFSFGKQNQHHALDYFYTNVSTLTDLKLRMLEFADDSSFIFIIHGLGTYVTNKQSCACVCMMPKDSY